MQQITLWLSDRFEAQIYYVKTLNLFHTIDYDARPTFGDWVVVRRRGGSGLAIQRFRGQHFIIGVARVLSFYSLIHSEQDLPRSLPV